MKRIYSLLFCAAALFGTVSCDNADQNDDVVVPDESVTASYLYTLNGGKYTSNNASLTSYNIESGAIVDDLFATVNGQGLGDTAQDVIQLGDYIYIAVYNSGVIFVTDLEGAIMTTITNETYSYPRYFASDDEYIYVSYYDGAVAKISPESNTIVAEAAVATNLGNPEKLVEVDGSIYIAVSDYGYGNEVSKIYVYDASTMTFTKSIDLLIGNPTAIEADSDGNLYVISMGDYYTIPSTLQKIDAQTGEVTVIDITEIEDAAPTMMTMGADNVLYVVEGVSNASTGWAMVGNVYAYDTTTGGITTFITDGTSISNMYSISANVENGELYVGTSDYTNTGDVYVLNADGTLNTTIGVGMNPMKTISIVIEE
ncbi:MAG: hypothetical protein R3Y39_02145 [Rikenellaceae bacterium]